MISTGMISVAAGMIGEQLDLVNGHPVVYAGAGSHASYFRPGEYQAEVSLPLPNWFSGITKVLNKFWTETLGQPEGNPFRIPFVDFARGDGLGIGEGEKHAWSPVVIDEFGPMGQPVPRVVGALRPGSGLRRECPCRPHV